MLVERHAVLALGVGDVLGREPMREAAAFIISGDDANGLAEDALTEGRATATGLIRDDERETDVLRPRPKRGFAEARMSDHRDALGIDGGVAL